jgi:Sigma-70, region 4
MMRKMQYGYPVPFERDTEMFSRFKQGRSMADIGREYGVCRERVRQIIAHCFGLTGKDNIWADSILLFKMYLKKKDHIYAKRKRRELIRYSIFGCHEEILTYINGKPFSWSNKDRYGTTAGEYLSQKRTAKIRGISWDLTFPEWWNIWKESGKYPMRGQHRGEYVMSRYGDHGPYHKDNVRICLATENIKEYYELNTREEIVRRRQAGRERNRQHELQATA